MSRSRSGQSLLEQIAEPFAGLPPLAGLIAVILLAALGWAAPLFTRGSVIAGAWLQFGRWLIWLLAGLVLAYTLVGVVRRFVDRRTFNTVDDLANLTWSQFERFIAEFYRLKGAAVSYRGGSTADGGVDLILTYPSRERFIVQCKHGRNRQVGVKSVRELWGVLGARRRTARSSLRADRSPPTLLLSHGISDWSMSMDPSFAR